MRGFQEYASTSAGGSSEYQRWVALADGYAAEGTVERVYADYSLAIVALVAARNAESWAFRAHALEVARTLDDEHALAAGVGAVLQVPPSPTSAKVTVEVVREFADHQLDVINHKTSRPRFST